MPINKEFSQPVFYEAPKEKGSGVHSAPVPRIPKEEVGRLTKEYIEELAADPSVPSTMVKTLRELWEKYHGSEAKPESLKDKLGKTIVDFLRK